MLVTMLRCKLHRATVTECDLHYQGSLKIDADLIRAAGFLPNEHIEVYNIDNGERFTTYVIEGRAGSGVDLEEAKTHKPRIVVLGASNKIERITDRPTVE
jgi:aspartate 1-decarboxylase